MLLSINTMKTPSLFLAKIGNKLPNMGHVIQSFVTFAFQMVDPK